MSDWRTTKSVATSSKSDAGSVHCYGCDRKTRHDVLASVFEESATDCGMAIIDGSPSTLEMWSCTNYEIIKCRGCEHIVFRMRNRFSEDTEFSPVDDGHGGTDYIDTPVERVDIYPRSAGRIGFFDSRFLPARVRDVYQETCSAIVYDNRILAGIGLRAILETICKGKGASGRNLQEKIDDLVTQGILSANAAATLHKIRFLGNRAAHEVSAESAKNVGIALRIIENLMEQTYILQAEASVLPDS